MNYRGWNPLPKLKDNINDKSKRKDCSHRQSLELKGGEASKVEFSA